MNISEQFRQHYLETLPDRALAEKLSNRQGFPHALWYTKSMVQGFCIDMYITRQLVKFYTNREYRDPAEDSELRMEVFFQIDPFVFEPAFYHKHIIQADRGGNDHQVQQAVLGLETALSFSDGNQLIDHFNHCLQDDRFVDMAFGMDTLEPRLDEPLQEQYRTFLLNMEYECLKEVLPEYAGFVPAYDEQDFRGYMETRLNLAHLMLMIPY